MLRHLPLALFAVGLISPFTPGIVLQQGEPTDPKPVVEPVSLQVIAKVGRRVLAEAEWGAECQVTVSNPAGEDTKQQFAVEGTHKVVDEYTEVGSGIARSTRRILEWEQEQDGETVENEFVGATLEFVEGDEVVLSVHDDRIGRLDTLEEMLLYVGSVGLWVRLPDAIVPGEVFEADLDSLAGFLMTLGEEPSNSACKLQLVSVDDAGIALVRGTHSFSILDEISGVPVTTDFRGEVELHVDLAERMITRASWGGEASGSGDGRGIEIALSLKIRAEATAKTGSAVDKASARKPRFQNNTHVSKDGSVSFALPSPWVDLSTDDADDAESLQLYDGRHGSDGGRHSIMIQVFPSLDPKVSLKSAVERVMKDYPDAKVKSVSSKLGRGRSMVWAESGRTVYVDIFAGKKSLARVISGCPAEESKMLDAALKVLRKSMKEVR